eukprot:Nitzschia sp. Nitz4//scaffold93_size78505//14768//15526//NITZ4_005413-RA/size78505-processed-gene-0.28-mRNA-1//-1//CDS//3329560267//2338//frame0
MPPHSTDCTSYYNVFDEWFQKRHSLFCGRSLPCQPSTVEYQERPSSPVDRDGFSLASRVEESMGHSDNHLEDLSRSTSILLSRRGGRRHQAKKPRRHIQFDPDFEVYEIPHFNDLPPSQLEQMHLTRDEMAVIHAEAWETVELMNLGIEYAESDAFSKRGLVDLKDDSVERRRRVREQAYKVVFGVQAYGVQSLTQLAPNHQPQTPDTPSSNGGLGYSPQVMGVLYSQVSSAAQEVANEVAKLDALAAAELY